MITEADATQIRAMLDRAPDAVREIRDGLDDVAERLRRIKEPDEPRPYVRKGEPYA